jgi:hypothetical protein
MAIPGWFFATECKEVKHTQHDMQAIWQLTALPAKNEH